jgi:hypothetical protein
MLWFRVFGTHQSQPSLFARSPFLLTLYSNSFFSIDYALFSQRPHLNPLHFNHFRTLFIAMEGVPLAIQSADLSTSFRAILLPLKLLRTLLHDFALFCAHQKLNSFVFSRFCTLCQKTRGTYPLVPLAPVSMPGCLCGNPFLGAACPDVN